MPLPGLDLKSPMCLCFLFPSYKDLEGNGLRELFLKDKLGNQGQEKLRAWSQPEYFYQSITTSGTYLGYASGGYSTCGHKESDTTKQLTQWFEEDDILKLKDLESQSYPLKKNHALELSDSNHLVMFVRTNPLLC